MEDNLDEDVFASFRERVESLFQNLFFLFGSSLYFPQVSKSLHASDWRLSEAALWAVACVGSELKSSMEELEPILKFLFSVPPHPLLSRTGCMLLS